MTGPNIIIDQNPENEENQIKISHVTKFWLPIPAANSYSTLLVTYHLNSELACGDIPTTTYSFKKSSISREYQVMNESNDVDFLLRLKSMSVFWGQLDRGLGVLCWDFIVYLGFQAFALVLQTSN